MKSTSGREAEYSDIEKKELRQEKDVYGRDIQFLLRLFEKHTWIHVDLAYMDTMKKWYPCHIIAGCLFLL